MASHRGFSLDLNVGNEAMRDEYDVARALRAVADRLDDGEFEGRVRDDNGNTVGRFELR